jgi:hypothetical protein
MALKNSESSVLWLHILATQLRLYCDTLRFRPENGSALSLKNGQWSGEKTPQNGVVSLRFFIPHQPMVRSDPIPSVRCSTLSFHATAVAHLPVPGTPICTG